MAPLLPPAWTKQPDMRHEPGHAAIRQDFQVRIAGSWINPKYPGEFRKVREGDDECGRKQGKVEEEGGGDGAAAGGNHGGRDDCASKNSDPREGAPLR